jgi:hypothetical protein
MVVFVVWDGRVPGGTYGTKANEVDFTVMQFLEY